MGLQIPSNQLRPFDECLIAFTRDQVEVRGYPELRTTTPDGEVATTNYQVHSY